MALKAKTQTKKKTMRQKEVEAKEETIYESCRPQACNFIKKVTLEQVFSCEFCEICKNTFFTEHLWTTASISERIFYLDLKFSWSQRLNDWEITHVT